MSWMVEGSMILKKLEGVLALPAIELDGGWSQFQLCTTLLLRVFVIIKEYDQDG